VLDEHRGQRRARLQQTAEVLDRLAARAAQRSLVAFWRRPGSSRKSSSGATMSPARLPPRLIALSSPDSASRIRNSASRTRSAPPASVRCKAPTRPPSNWAPGPKP
jgi:hypothetical protein